MNLSFCAVSTWRQLRKPSQIRVQVYQAHKDVVNDKNVTTCRTVALPGAAAGPAVPIADAACISHAPHGSARLTFQNGPPVTIEIWHGSCKRRETEVPAAVHGPLVADGYCSTGPAWSRDCEYVAYVAEVRLEIWQQHSMVNAVLSQIDTQCRVQAQRHVWGPTAHAHWLAHA